MTSSILFVIGTTCTRLRCISRAVVLFFLTSYQKHISPMFPARCRYYPTCSAYAVGAVKTHGAFKGLLLTSWRLLRCNPMTLGGIDHVPEKGQWRYSSPRDTPHFLLKQ